jgi:hypothetical protein
MDSKAPGLPDRRIFGTCYSRTAQGGGRSRHALGQQSANRKLSGNGLVGIVNEFRYVWPAIRVIRKPQALSLARPAVESSPSNETVDH